MNNSPLPNSVGKMVKLTKNTDTGEFLMPIRQLPGESGQRSTGHWIPHYQKCLFHMKKIVKEHICKEQTSFCSFDKNLVNNPLNNCPALSLLALLLKIRSYYFLKRIIK